MVNTLCYYFLLVKVSDIFSDRTYGKTDNEPEAFGEFLFNSTNIDLWNRTNGDKNSPIMGETVTEMDTTIIFPPEL